MEQTYSVNTMRNWTGDNGLAGQYDNVTTTGGTGTGLKINVTMASASGQFSQSAVPAATSPTNAVAATLP